MKQLQHILFCCSLLVLLSAAPLVAQQGGGPQDLSKDKREKIEALRVAYITKKLNLTPQEAQSFWPIYNEYTNKLETLRAIFVIL